MKKFVIIMKKPTAKGNGPYWVSPDMDYLIGILIPKIYDHYFINLIVYHRWLIVPEWCTEISWCGDVPKR